MDAKNSPLALLAQTCSAIGSDAPNAKLVANMEKSSKSHQSNGKSENRDKLSPGSHGSSLSNGSSETNAGQLHHQHQQQHQQLHQQKSSFKPYESSLRDNRTSPLDDRSGSGRIKTPKSSHTPSATIGTANQQNGRCDSNQSASSQRAMSPATIRKTPSVPSGGEHHSTSPHRASSKESPLASSSSSLNLQISSSQGSPYYSSSKLSDSTRESSVSYPKTSTAMSVAAAQAASSAAAASAAYYNGYGAPGLPYPMDLMTASALMSPHHAMFKAASMNPYLNYARMKGPGGSDPMMPVCRDPYCTGCALSPHMMSKSAGAPCPAGCTQCDHTTASKSYASQLSAAHGSVAAAYAHAQLAALAAASQLPYICNWIAGDAAYCGKRFGNSDELLQHLRTHTSAMNESMLNPATAAAAMAAGLPPNHPLFQRTYPTPPLSPLSTARYHPYSKPQMLPTSLAPQPPPPVSMAGMPQMHHPSLAQYFSPYSLYGPRIGQSHP